MLITISRCFQQRVQISIPNLTVKKGDNENHQIDELHQFSNDSSCA